MVVGPTSPRSLPFASATTPQRCCCWRTVAVPSPRPALLAGLADFRWHQPMNAHFQPKWTGDQKHHAKTGSNNPDAAMWGNAMKKQDIDQSAYFNSGPSHKPKVVSEAQAVGILHGIMGNAAMNASINRTLDMGSLRGQLKGQHQEQRDKQHRRESASSKSSKRSRRDTSELSPTSAAVIARRTSSRSLLSSSATTDLAGGGHSTDDRSPLDDRSQQRRQTRGRKAPEKVSQRREVQKMYKRFGFGKNDGTDSATGQSMALAVVKRTATLAKEAAEDAAFAAADTESNLKPSRRKSYMDLLAKVESVQTASGSQASGPPDLPIGLPRGRLVHTHIFLLGRKMTVEVLRQGRDTVRYECADEEMRTYALETTERELYSAMSEKDRTEVAHTAVEVQIPLILGRLGFRISKKDKRKKELAILKAKGSSKKKAGGTVGGQGKSRWAKIKKVTGEIGEDLFRSRLQKNSGDVSALMGWASLKVRQGQPAAAAILFCSAVREAKILTVDKKTGRHSLKPHHSSVVHTLFGGGGDGKQTKDMFGARFWIDMAQCCFDMYLDDLRVQCLNVALDCSEIAARFLENVANQKLWILRGRIHESLGHLQEASDLYEHCIAHFGKSQMQSLESAFFVAPFLEHSARMHAQPALVTVASDSYRPLTALPPSLSLSLSLTVFLSLTYTQ